MRTASYILCSTLLLGLGLDSASAKTVTVNVTAHVTGWTDVPGALGGQIALGQAISGTYTYDTITPDLDPSNNGHYQPSGTQASVSVSTGALSFESIAPSGFDIYILPSSPPGNSAGNFTIISNNDKPLASGAWVNEIAFHFADSAGNEPTSDALPSDAPDQNFSIREIRVEGYLNGGNFEVIAQIDSVQLVPSPLEVSPATGSFLPQQRFDAALFLPAGTQIASMQASAGGNPLPFSYPGTCQLASPNIAGRPAILCPDAYQRLPALGGATQINWQVMLMDGTLLNQTVQWQLIQ